MAISDSKCISQTHAQTNRACLLLIYYSTVRVQVGHNKHKPLLTKKKPGDRETGNGKCWNLEMFNVQPGNEEGMGNGGFLAFGLKKRNKKKRCAVLEKWRRWHWKLSFAERI